MALNPLFQPGVLSGTFGGRGGGREAGPGGGLLHEVRGHVHAQEGACQARHEGIVLRVGGRGPTDGGRSVNPGPEMEPCSGFRRLGVGTCRGNKKLTKNFMVERKWPGVGGWSRVRDGQGGGGGWRAHRLDPVTSDTWDN